MDVIKLSELLKELMGDGSAEDLAERIGLPGQTVRNYVTRPGSKPGIDKLAKIANYMGISLDELAVRIGIDVPNKKRALPNVVTVDDAYALTRSLPHRGRIDLCARLLSETSASYKV